VLREAADIYSNEFGQNYADHPDVGFPLVNLARNLQAQGRYAEAEPLAARALTVFRASFGDDHALTARAYAAHGMVLADMGRPADALPDLQAALRIRTAELPADSPDLGISQSRLGDALRLTGRRAEAEPLLRQGLATLRATLDADDERVVDAERRLAAMGDE
jgi:tetratricopeptide (TPR) repeat protein